jgi:hypothetical protein
MSSVDDYLWKKRKIEPVARFDCYTHSTGWFEPPIPSPWITVVHNPHQASQYKLQHAVTINRSSLQVVSSLLLPLFLAFSPSSQVYVHMFFVSHNIHHGCTTINQQPFLDPSKSVVLIPTDPHPCLRRLTGTSQDPLSPVGTPRRAACWKRETSLIGWASHPKNHSH